MNDLEIVIEPVRYFTINWVHNPLVYTQMSSSWKK